MPLSHTAREMMWIEAWSDLLEHLDRAPLALINARGERIDVESCKGEIQDQAYRGFRAKLVPFQHRGQRALRVIFEEVKSL